MTYVKAMHFFTSVSNEWPASSKDHPRFLFLSRAHTPKRFSVDYTQHNFQLRKVCVSKSEVFFSLFFFTFRIFQHCRHQANRSHLTSPKRLFKVTCKTWISEQTRLNIWTVKNEGNLRVAFCSIMLTRWNIEPLCGYFPTKSKSRRPVLMKRWS